MNKNQGFTTIELVTVIIIVGILAVNIVPKFDGTSSYQAHTHRAQLIAALRLTQQRAMQQTGSINTNQSYCHRLVVEGARYGIDNRVALDCSIQNINAANWVPDLTGHIVEQGNNITYLVDGTRSKTITFDWLGRPGEDCNNGCVITVKSELEVLQASWRS